jgi:uncharacterized YccA/Bax inhibitor family protein
VRSSSNPAFRTLSRGQGNATFDRTGGTDTAFGGVQPGQVGPGGAGTADRPLTVDDVVMKTGISAGTAIVTGALTIVLGLNALALPAFLVGFVVSLVLIFKPRLAQAPLVLLYSAAMGIALGGITGYIDQIYPGIGLQALVGTAGVFIGMLVVYKTGAVRVTPRFTKWLLGAFAGVILLMLFDLVMSLFGINTGLRDGGPLAIIFSLVIIGVAAFSLLLDFDQADQAIRGGAPARLAWYIAFGLMTTLVWLYIEILRLLSYLRDN